MKYYLVDAVTLFGSRMFSVILNCTTSGMSSDFPAPSSGSSSICSSFSYTISPCPQSLPASGSFQMSQLCIRWPKYWNFSFNINLSNEVYITQFQNLIQSKSIWWGTCVMSILKRFTTWELQDKFYLGKNEDCSPGDNTPDSSEKLLQRGRGGRLIYVILMKGESSTHCTKGFMLGTRSQCHHEGI